MPTGFESFSLQHYSTLLIFGLVTWAIIRKGQAANEKEKRDYAIWMAGVAFVLVIAEAVILLITGQYNIYIDLPLHLCDLVAIIMFFVLLTNNRTWIGILYFWAMAGTLQALLTPDLQMGFPSLPFLKYFFSHGLIVSTILYVVIVWRIQITWKDFFHAILYGQFYLIGAHIINAILGSNYAYTLYKPAGSSILDLLGPWPWYILWGEVLMILLFLVLMLPFARKT